MAKIGQMDYCERDILIKLRERLRGKNNIFFAYFLFTGCTLMGQKWRRSVQVQYLDLAFWKRMIVV